MSSYKGDQKVLYGWQVCHVLLPFSSRFDRRRDRTKKQPSVCYWPSELPFVSVVKQQVLIFRSKPRCIILPFAGQKQGWLWATILSWRSQAAELPTHTISPSPAKGLQPCWSNSGGRCAACLNSSASQGLGEARSNLQSGGCGSLCAAEKALARLCARSTGGISAAGSARGSGPWGMLRLMQERLELATFVFV